MNIQVFEIDRIDHVTWSFMTKTDKKRHFTYHIKSQVRLFWCFDLNAVFKIKLFQSLLFRTNTTPSIQLIWSSVPCDPHCNSYFSASDSSSSGSSSGSFISRGICISFSVWVKWPKTVCSNILKLRWYQFILESIYVMELMAFKYNWNIVLKI